MRHILIVLLSIQQGHSSATCFLKETTSTPYIAFSITSEKSLQWCFTVCDENAACIGVVYNDDGSCVRQKSGGISGSLQCIDPYDRYKKSDVGCLYPNPMSAMTLPDACSPRLMPHLLTYDDGKFTGVCPMRAIDGSEGPPIVIRYKDATTGIVHTLDNVNKNILTYDFVNSKWSIWYKDCCGEKTIVATAIACAEITNPTACPCGTLPQYTEGNQGTCVAPTLEATPSCAANPTTTLVSPEKYEIKHAFFSGSHYQQGNMHCKPAGEWMVCITGSVCSMMKLAGCCTP